MVRQYHWLNVREFEQISGGCGGQRNMVCCSPWGHKAVHELVTEQQQQKYLCHKLENRYWEKSCFCFITDSYIGCNQRSIYWHFRNLITCCSHSPKNKWLAPCIIKIVNPHPIFVILSFQYAWQHFSQRLICILVVCKIRGLAERAIIGGKYYFVPSFGRALFEYNWHYSLELSPSHSLGQLECRKPCFPIRTLVNVGFGNDHSLR